MAEHRNTTATVRMVLKACDAVNVDTDKLLKVAGISRQTAEDPDGEVSFEQMRAFWMTAFNMSSDPYLAMRAAEKIKIGDYKCWDYLTVHATTLGQSLEYFCRYMLLMNTWIGWEINKGKEFVTLRMISSAGVIPPPSYEFVFSACTIRSRFLAGDNWAPTQVKFPFQIKPNPEIHRDFFKCDVQYDAPTGEYIVDIDSWNKELPNGDEQLLQVLDQHARMLLANRPMPDDFIGKVKQEIIKDLHGGEATRETIAKRLNMSSRTLQRRLEEQGIAFADLLDEIRTELAKNKLQGSDLSLAEIGFLLGFSEQSSFTRAFKRWTGKTPLEYRRECKI